MDAKTATAGATIGLALTFGAIDASVLNEQPLERVETVAEEVVRVEQKGNVVEAVFPWKDQPGIKVSYDMGVPTAAERLADKRKKQVVTETVPFQSGQGFKVDILLNEKPASNCFLYQLEGWEDYDFFYQPPLTQEEMDEGAERPEEIVGSYAVYHKTLKNHRMGSTNYETGKFAHIPYPYVWEVDNPTSTKHRAESFSIENGVMTVCASEKFIDSANYPVRIDPTFGYTTLGATNNTICTDLNQTRRGSLANLGESGTLAKITLGLRRSAGSAAVTAVALLNRANDPSSNNHSLVSEIQQDVTLTTTAAFFDFNASSEALSADDYVLNALCDRADATEFQSNQLRSDNAAATTFSEAGATFATLRDEDPWTETGSSGTVALYSIYATYTASGGGESTPTPQSIIWFD